MNRDRLPALPGPGSEGVQTVLNRDRAAAVEPVQSVMSRERALPGPGAGAGVDGLQTVVVSPEDGGGVADKRLFSSPVSSGRDPQPGEEHTEPPPTNPVPAPPQQVHARTEAPGFPVRTVSLRKSKNVRVYLKGLKPGLYLTGLFNGFNTVSLFNGCELNGHKQIHRKKEKNV